MALMMHEYAIRFIHLFIYSLLKNLGKDPTHLVTEALTTDSERLSHNRGSRVLGSEPTQVDSNEAPNNKNITLNIPPKTSSKHLKTSLENMQEKAGKGTFGGTFGGRKSLQSRKSGRFGGTFGGRNS